MADLREGWDEEPWDTEDRVHTFRSSDLRGANDEVVAEEEECGEHYYDRDATRGGGKMGLDCRVPRLSGHLEEGNRPAQSYRNCLACAGVGTD